MAAEYEEEGRPWSCSPKKRKKVRETGQTLMDLRNQVYHGVENEEGCLVVGVVDGGT
jgi:hypothetical protein